jgi:formate hydrogenlyase subunit 6/NADH:ubiquinone oxidoreductase subunit I
LRSNEVERFKYNKNVHIAVIGKCGGCYHCVDVCQENAIKEWMPPTINHSRCTRCMKCVESCPRNIMQIVC